VAHADARTTVSTRKLIVDRVGAGHRPGEVAKQLGVSRQAVYKWVRRWWDEGGAGLADHSRPHRMPRRTSAQNEARIVAALPGMAASTIGAVIARAGIPSWPR
jgi:transposase